MVTRGRKGSGSAPAAGPGPRELTRRELESAAPPLPRVVLLSGGDPVLAAEIAGRLTERVGTPGMESFNRDTLQASEIKFRDLASRVEELPMLSTERCIVVRGAEALLKQGAEALRAVWPAAGAGTVLILLAAEEDAKASGARKAAPRWADVLPGHAVRVSVGSPTAEDAVRWGRQAALEAGAQVEDAAFKAAHRRAGGDGARLRTAIEHAVLGALCGQTAEGAGTAREMTLEEAEAQLQAVLGGDEWRGVWAAAERFRVLGGRMDSSGAAWVRRMAEKSGTGGAGAVDALRALSTLQLRWRREVGTARRVLESSALELALTRVRRKEST